MLTDESATGWKTRKKTTEAASCSPKVVIPPLTTASASEPLSNVHVPPEPPAENSCFHIHPLSKRFPALESEGRVGSTAEMDDERGESGNASGRVRGHFLVIRLVRVGVMGVQSCCDKPPMLTSTCGNADSQSQRAHDAPLANGQRRGRRGSSQHRRVREAGSRSAFTTLSSLSSPPSRVHCACLFAPGFR